MKNLTLLLFISLQIFYSTQLQALGELVVRMSVKAFPASFQTADGWRGMDVDVLNEMMSDTGLSYKVVLIPFKRAMTEIAKGQIDLVTNLTKNPQRSKDMYWIGPVRNTKVGFVVLKKNQGAAINNIGELIGVLEAKHQQIGHVIGVSYSPFLDDNIENNVLFNEHIWKSATRGQIVEMLQKDRIFGFFQDKFEAKSLINAYKNDLTHPYSEFAIRESSIDNSLSGAYFGISKYLEQSKIDKLSQAFNQMQHDGRLQKISKKWSGKATLPRP